MLRIGYNICTNFLGFLSYSDSGFEKKSHFLNLLNWNGKDPKPVAPHWNGQETAFCRRLRLRIERKKSYQGKHKSYSAMCRGTLNKQHHVINYLSKEDVPASEHYIATMFSSMNQVPFHVNIFYHLRCNLCCNGVVQLKERQSERLCALELKWFLQC